MRSLGVDALALRLDQRFALLTGQRGRVDARHRNLQALVEWSYEPSIRSIRRCSRICRCSRHGPRRRRGRVSSGRRDWASAARRDRLGRQVDGAAGRPRRARYRLLETLREFGQERLAGDGMFAPVEERHRAWFLAVAERAAVELDGADEDVGRPASTGTSTTFGLPMTALCESVISPPRQAWSPICGSTPSVGCATRLPRRGDDDGVRTSAPRRSC